MTQPLLEIKNIIKQYGTTKALKGVSLNINPGTIVSLLGVNGAGKTTLSSILASLKPPTSGEVLFEGKSIYTDITHYRRAMGYCPQWPNLHSQLSVEENLTAAGRYYGLSDLEIKQRVYDLSHELHFNTRLNDMPNTLSGGYKRRVLIARSIIHKPKFIILDEPTVALDPQVRNDLWVSIKKLKTQGIAILLTTHYLDEAEVLSDVVCVLDKGLVRIIDTPTQLMTAFKKKRLEEVFIELTSKPQE